jgi:asparagine synthase (glutamine-hydrolysing)
MCGIAGFVGTGTENDLVKMTRALAHRGPDDEGVFFENGVGLGHRRLSIIDLSLSGHQPMFSSAKDTGVVFNGEIYNFKELKKDLEKEGIVFKSNSDTEVILVLYEKYGEECFKKMEGMFAIAIYDFKNKKLILSRDRLGKKPLYWGMFGETLVFASELKSFVLHSLVTREIDRTSLCLYLQTDYVPTPRTIFKNIYKLEPGFCLLYQNTQFEKKQFWSIKESTSEVSLPQAVRELDVLLESSVNSRLISDVPFGVFLSGGLDSSTIAYYAQKNSKKKIHTFSIGFQEKSFDESKYATEVSKYLGTEHHHLDITAEDSLKVIPYLADILDEPMADASIIPTYLLSQFTKLNVTVALGGDGADELFAGYPTFQADKLANIYTKLPKRVKAFLKILVTCIPVSDKNFSIGFRLKKFIEGLDENKFLRHQKWLGTFNENDLIKLLTYKLEDDTLGKWVREIIPQSFSKDGNDLLRFYIKTYMMDQVLVKVDRASMKNSLETRSPFLSYKVVDFVMSLPYRYKLRCFQTKYILKKLMRDKLPKRIIFRKKKGFGIPLSKWLKDDLKSFLNQVINKEKVENMGIFNWNYIESILADHFSGKVDNRKKIWNLLVFVLWWEKWAK